jgi:hypothetical protein
MLNNSSQNNLFETYISGIPLWTHATGITFLVVCQWRAIVPLVKYISDAIVVALSMIVPRGGP